MAPQVARFTCLVLRRFRQDRCTRVAAALSFTTLLAVVPLTAVALALLSALPGFESWLQTIQKFIYSNFVPASGDVVSRYLQRFAANAGRLTVWGTLFLVVTAYMVLATIEQTFNDIWHVTTKRRWWPRLLGYTVLMTLGPILIGTSLWLTTSLLSLPVFGRHAPLGGFRGVVLDTLPVVFEFLAFFLLYRVAPNFPVRLRHALVGALVAAVLFEIAKRGFGAFIVYFSTYKKIYGALAALPVFLVWVFLSWTVTLIGALVTAALPDWRAQPACDVVLPRRGQT